MKSIFNFLFGSPQKTDLGQQQQRVQASSATENVKILGVTPEGVNIYEVHTPDRPIMLVAVYKDSVSIAVK